MKACPAWPRARHRQRPSLVEWAIHHNINEPSTSNVQPELSSRQTYHDTIISTRPTATLSVAQSCHTGIETKTLSEDFADSIGVNGVQLPVVGTFGDDDDGLALSDLTVLLPL